jgi:ABC-2 type transport system ATP-binding protein
MDLFSAIKSRLFNKPLESEHLVNVKSLSIKYGIKNILRNVNFSVDKRDTFGIIGLSGSGKTTILKALMKLLPHYGLIEFSKTVKNIGYCPQEDAFFDELTIKENAIIMSSLVSVDYLTLMHRLKVYMKELMLNEPLNKLASELSGGQKKRLNIILSLLNDPELVIMDEPFAELDYLNRSLLWQFIVKLKGKGKTVILTTHLLEEAQKYCNKILIITNGKRFALGSIAELKRRFNFNQFMRIRFNYLNKQNLLKLKDYCLKNEALVLEAFNNYVSFSLPNEEFKALLETFFNNNGLKYSIVEFRPPNLNDLFLVSSNERKNNPTKTSRFIV